MSDALTLGFDDVDLLLLVAETPAMAISGAALNDFYNNAASVLVAAGAIKPDDFEAVAVTEAGHDDAVVSLTWSSELGGYAYFSSANGLVRVDEGKLRRFKLDISWFVQWIGHQLGIRTTSRFTCLVPDRLWDLGDIWLGDAKRSRRRTAIYLSRRLAEPETVREVAATLRMHRTRSGKIILTTSNDLGLARTIVADSCPILAIKSCVRAGIENFELDHEIIYSAAHELSLSCRKFAVKADSDFRTVWVGDRQFDFRGDKQRQVVGFLYRRWKKEEGPVSTAFMFEELGLHQTKRLRDLFKDHPSWRGLVGDKNGTCWLRCDEILSAAEDGAGAASR